MSEYRVSPAARSRIEDIYAYSFGQWGEAQAQKYVNGLFDCFGQIAGRQVQWRPVPAGFGVSGYFTRYEKHFIFWRKLPDGAVGIVSVLDQRMDIGNRLREDVP